MTDAGAADDRVRLVLPADPAYGRIARIATAGLALRLGLDLAAVEDLRIAVDETVILLLGPEPRHGSLTFELTVAPAELVIDARVADGRPTLDEGAVGRFAEIVDDTVDTWSVDPDARHVRLARQY